MLDASKRAIDLHAIGEKIEFSDARERTRGRRSDGIITLGPGRDGPSAHIHTQQVEGFEVLSGTMVVAAVVHSLAEVVPGVGIAVPMLAPPLVAAGVALLLAFRRAPPVAYVAGSMGTLIGADLLNLGKIPGLGAPHRLHRWGRDFRRGLLNGDHCRLAGVMSGRRQLA